MMAGWWAELLNGSGLGGYTAPCYPRVVRFGTILLLEGLLVAAVACAPTRISPEGKATPGVSRDAASTSGLALPARPEEWHGQIVKIDQDGGYIVVRSRERLLDHVFRLTPQTEITSKASPPPVLEPGQWVTVQYHKDRTQVGPPEALRVVVAP